jgi:hypothetical protein
MIKTIFSFATPIQLYVFITFIVALLFHNLKFENAKYLFAILLLNAATEFISILLISENRPIGFLINVSVFFHNCLWLSLLLKSVKNRAIYKAVFVLFVVSDLLIFFFDRILAFSCLAFVFGAFVYLIIFIVESFYELQREAFSFSFKSIFVVVCAGIIFYWA